MRGIKFRVWSEDQKTYNYQFPYNKLGQFYVSENGKVFSDFGNTVAPEVRQEAFVVEQYTGLKDKNGKEIYEGDIISFHDYGSFAIKFHKGCFRLGSGDLLYAYPSSAIEVIGNIHENPELLGGGK